MSQPVRHRAALLLVADVRLPLGAVIGAAGHDDLHHAGLALLGLRIVILHAGPVGAQLDERLIKVHATEGGRRADRDRQHAVLGEARPSGAARESNAAAHADDHRLAFHRLAFHRLRALLEMRHQIGGDEREAFRIAHQGLQRGPLGFELLLLGQLLAFGDLLKLRVELRQLTGVQAQLGDAALVIDRHRGLVRHGALDVVDADVIAEDRPRVRVRLLDGRAGEADEARVRQGIAQAAGKAVGNLAGFSLTLRRHDLALRGAPSTPTPLGHQHLPTRTVSAWFQCKLRPTI